MPAKKHDFTATEIKAGLLVICSGVALVGFIAVIQGARVPVQVAEYHVEFTNTIGLNRNADVRFGGLKVGKVTEVSPDPEDQASIRVTVAIAPEVPVNEDCVASVEQVTLTAERHLEISTGSSDAARIAPGGQIESKDKSYGFLDLSEFGGLTGGAEDLLGDVRDFLGVQEAKKKEQEGTAEFTSLSDITSSVSGTLEGGTELVDKLKGVLDENSPAIKEILDKVKGIEDSAQELVTQLNGILAENREPLNQSLGQVQAILEDVGALVDSLSGDIEALIASLQTTLENAEGLSGTAADFLEANRPAIEDIVLDLRATLRNLNVFSRTLAEQPQAVIRGKSPQGRKE